MKRDYAILIGVLVISVMISLRCSMSTGVKVSAEPYQELSEYGFFTGKLQDLDPNEGVLPYELITPLFTDYAGKARFVWMPEGSQATYRTEERTLEFPVGTVLIKNFYYNHDDSKPEDGRRIIETRLLVHREGKWDALTYVWNDEQDEAFLNIIGDDMLVEWKDMDGVARSINYMVPNKNQCKGCHEYDGKLEPIGPKVRNLNMMYSYAEGPMNQLEKWANIGYLSGYEAEADHPAVADWDDPLSGTLHERAMAYLDVNCGHCHNPKGPASTSGLNLTYYEAFGPNLGICKSPVSAGKGSGGFDYDIVPGKPDSSILVYRMHSLDPGAMMPEVGRTIVHTEGVALIEDWIASLSGDCNRVLK